VLVTAADASVLLELGPISGKTATSETTQALLKSSEKMTGESAVSFISAASVDGSLRGSIPKGSESVVIIRDAASGRVWLIAAQCPVEDLRTNKEWISSLVKAPVS
jgi:hypothetical protein